MFCFVFFKIKCPVENSISLWERRCRFLIISSIRVVVVFNNLMRNYWFIMIHSTLAAVSWPVKENRLGKQTTKRSF